MTLLAKGVICFTDTLILHTRNLLMLGVVLCSACAPLVNRPGKPVQAPSLGHSHFAAADGAVLPMRSWLPPAGMPAKAVIVALHGFNDYSRFFTGPGEFLSRRGFACYAYDQRGFGNSPGWGLWGGMDAGRTDGWDTDSHIGRRLPLGAAMVPGPTAPRSTPGWRRVPCLWTKS